MTSFGCSLNADSVVEYEITDVESNTPSNGWDDDLLLRIMLKSGVIECLCCGSLKF